jgi:hypothetical protein
MFFLKSSSTKVETISTSKLKVGGRSSRLFKKLGYNIKLPKGEHFEGYKSLKLRSIGSDPSYMREYLVSEMMKSASVPSSQFSFIR